MVSANARKQKLSFHDLVVKHTDRNLLSEMPAVIILNISSEERSDVTPYPAVGLRCKQVLQTSDPSATDSQSLSSSRFLNLPGETMVLIFQKLPPYFRLALAMACKELARLAMTHDLLVCDPATSRLLDGVKIRTIKNGRSMKVNTTVYPNDLGSRTDSAGCDMCDWHDVPASFGCFRHAQIEGRRLKLGLTKGMLWVLAYESIRRNMYLPDSYGKPGHLDQFPKAEIDKYLQAAVQYYERHMSRVVSDVIKQDSYECLKWKT